MIDFKLNEIGDIVLNEANQITPFRIDFSVNKYPKFKIDFLTKAIQENPSVKNRLRIYFNIDEEEKEKEYLIDSIMKDEEESQEIAIRLKTELGELDRYYDHFGSELASMRHRDLMNENNHAKIADFSRTAIADVLDNLNVSISRRFSTGNFQVENLDINVSNTSGNVSYTYSI